MISIVNIGPFDDPNPLGEREYEVRINGEVICTFKHTRMDGLAECLRRASKAVAAKQWENTHEVIVGDNYYILKAKDGEVF